jgi:hypothetical protein
VGPITYPNSYSVKYIIATLKENQRGAVAYGGLIWPKAAAQMFYLFAFLFNCNKNLIPPHTPKTQSQFYSVPLSKFISRHLLVCVFLKQRLFESLLLQGPGLSPPNFSHYSLRLLH